MFHSSRINFVGDNFFETIEGEIIWQLSLNCFTNNVGKGNVDNHDFLNKYYAANVETIYKNNRFGKKPSELVVLPSL
jgi:hypothetical protein